MLPAWKCVHALGIPIRVEEFQGNSESPLCVKTVLRQNGYLFRRAKSSVWLIDSPKFLKKNNAVQGFLTRNEDGWASITLQNNTWTHSCDGVYSDMDVMNKTTAAIWVVLRMWSCVEPFINLKTTIYLRTPDMEKHVRYECEPESGYYAVRQDYSGCKRIVQRSIRSFATPVLMSNGLQMVLSTPSESGWTSSKIFEFECFPPEKQADFIIQKCTEALAQAPPHLDAKISQHVAHSLFSICSKYHLPVNIEEPDLAESDKEALRLYISKIHEFQPGQSDTGSEEYDVGTGV